MISDTFVQTRYTLQSIFVNFWNSFVVLFPGIIAAIIVIVIGCVAGKIFGSLLTKVLKKVKLDEWIKEHELSKALYGKQFSLLFGSLLQYYIIILFLSEAMSLLNLGMLTQFTNLVVVYLPLLFGALIIAIIGLIIAEFVKKMILDTDISLPYKDYIAGGAKLLIVYIMTIVALQTAGFGVTILVNAFIIGFGSFAIMISLIIGVSFGFALKDDAKDIIKHIKTKSKKNK